MPKFAESALYFPTKTFTNEDFFQKFPEERDSRTWPKLGITNRHIIGEDEVPSDMGLKAAEKLLQAHPHLREEIDFILFTSPERDYYTPITAGVMQHKLGLKTDLGAMDVHQGCSSFIYLLSHAHGLIQIGAATKILVIAVSSLTNTIDENDKANRFIFGDGAAAYIIEKSDEQRFHSYYFGNDGSKKDKIIIRDGANRNPINDHSYVPFTNEFGEQQIPARFYQDGAGVFRFTLDRIPKMIDSLLEKNNLSKDDIDIYLLHQPNAFIVKALTKIAKLPAEKVVIDVEDYGNTVSLSIAILIHNLKKQNKIKPGMKIFIAAFGTGLSWNGCIWET
jgi:3-oxoacyl-[acyl-carrier-protein] synthase-3